MLFVVDFYFSYFFEFSCFDLESMKIFCSYGFNDYYVRFVIVNIFFEVENDRLENFLYQCSIFVFIKIVLCLEVLQLNYIVEEYGNNGIKFNVDLYFGEVLKEINNNYLYQITELKVVIQIEIQIYKCCKIIII